MAPWVASGLLSPQLGFGVLAIVVIATAVLLVAARGAVARLGGWRLLAGYVAALGVAVAFALCVQLVASLSVSEFLAALAFFGYASCVALAVVVVPIVCALVTKGYASGLRTITASMFAGLVLAVMAFVLQRSTVQEGRVLQLFVDTLFLVPFLAIVGAAFSIGARLPWNSRSIRN